MLNEIAEASGVAIVLDEAAIPVLPPVRAACEMLGLDPLYVANEGVAVAIVAPEDAERVLEAAARTSPGRRRRSSARSRRAAPRVALKTGLGATRPLIMLAGDQLPRIC